MLGVITGGPYSGKTTVVDVLARCGYRTAPEAAIEIIHKRASLGENYQPSRDRRAFQLTVMREQVEQYIRFRHYDTFFDRGVPDGIGYFLADRLPVPGAVLQAARQCRYDRVFLLDRLPWPEQDRWREEGPKTQREIHEGIVEAYRSQGYRVIPIPVLGVRDRRDLILSYL